MRQRAAEALGKLGDARAVGPLVAALKDSSVYQAAADALRKLGASAVDPLIAALKDNDREVRQRAAEALGKLGDTRAIEPLIAALKDSEREVRQRAAEALARMYKSGRLDEKQRHLILAQLKTITQRHADSHNDATCFGEHHDSHEDSGIGMSFLF